MVEGVELGDDPWALEEIARALPPGEQAARAALDAALHDLQGKLVGAARLPAARLAPRRARRPRGRSGSATPTRWRGVPRRPPRGFKRLKLKLGGRDGLDLERVRAVRGRRASCRSRST